MKRVLFLREYSEPRSQPDKLEEIFREEIESKGEIFELSFR